MIETKKIETVSGSWELRPITLAALIAIIEECVSAELPLDTVLDPVYRRLSYEDDSHDDIFVGLKLHIVTQETT
jgi:hypothetical protein